MDERDGSAGHRGRLERSEHLGACRAVLERPTNMIDQRVFRNPPERQNPERDQLPVLDRQPLVLRQGLPVEGVIRLSPWSLIAMPPNDTRVARCATPSVLTPP